MTKIQNNKPVYDREESLGHLYLEFEICLEFDAWDLGFLHFL